MRQTEKAAAFVPPPFACDPKYVHFSLEENSNSELKVTRQRIRRVPYQSSEVRVVGLPDAIEFVPIQRSDVESQRVLCRKTLWQWNVEEIQRQAARVRAARSRLTCSVNVGANLRQNRRSR